MTHCFQTALATERQPSGDTEIQPALAFAIPVADDSVLQLSGPIGQTFGKPGHCRHFDLTG
jgi:hypothetical protein